jgi:hypothetical protein
VTDSGRGLPQSKTLARVNGIAIIPLPARGM